MKSLLAGLGVTGGVVGGVVGGVALILLLLCIGPALLLWSVNSLAEIGGVSFYIEHSLWSYWVSFVFLITVRGSSSGSSK